MDWVNDYIGIPYRVNGRNKYGMDCYGLVCSVYSVILGITLPDWGVDDGSIAKSIEVLSKNVDAEVEGDACEEVDDPCDFDVVVVRRSGRAHHMGIFIKGGVLHSARGLGVVYEEYSRFLIEHPKETVRFYRWRR